MGSTSTTLASPTPAGRRFAFAITLPKGRDRAAERINEVIELIETLFGGRIVDEWQERSHRWLSITTARAARVEAVAEVLGDLGYVLPGSVQRDRE